MTTPYPAEVARTSLNHKQGTKSYHVTLIATSENKSVLIKRWGRTGAFGDVKFEIYNGNEEGEAAFEAIINDKRKRGYAIDTTDVVRALDLAELTKAVGRPTWAKMNPAVLVHIDSSISTTGVREADPLRFDENGVFADPQPRKVEITEEMIEADKRLRLEELRARNPNYGRF